MALSEDGEVFSDPVEVDETCMGGRRADMSNARRKELADTGRGPVGRTAVVGVKDRATKRVAARVVQRTDAITRRSRRPRLFAHAGAAKPQPDQAVTFGRRPGIAGGTYV